MRKLAQISIGQSSMPLMACDFDELYLDDNDLAHLVTVRDGIRRVRLVREWREAVYTDVEPAKKRP